MDTHDYHNKSPEELIALLLAKDEEIASLKEMLKLYRQRQFGRKSEKGLNLFDEAVIEGDTTEITEADETLHVKGHSRKKPGRKPLPADLPREQRIYDLSEAEKQCKCGKLMCHITNDTCEQLEIIPAKIFVIEHIKKKYACKHCEEQVKVAKMPAQPIARSIAAPGLLSHVLVSKFEDHLPLHRQEHILQRIGIDIPRATMSLWVIRSATLLQRLTDSLKKTILKYDIAYADETTVQVIKETKKSIDSKKYMWLFSGGPPEQFCYYYHYHPSRSQETPKTFFASFEGYLHCDGYAAYDALASSHPITLVGCLYHARRKFAEVAKLTKKKTGVANEVLIWIKKLSDVEEQIKDFSIPERYAFRLMHAIPIMEELHRYLIEIRPRVPPKNPLGEAITYTLNQWPKLLNYLKDGRLENNNNRSERAIKPFAIGRKGWLFANSVSGAEAAATIYSLIETCKHHKVEPYYWLRYVLQQLPLRNKDDDVSDLLPFNIDPALLKA